MKKRLLDSWRLMKNLQNFEHFKDRWLEAYKGSKVGQSMAYVLDGGQRLRAQIILAIVNGHGLPEERAYHSALALEMIHAYSLVHDDLPCMDDDDMRRGKPSCHIAFGEDIAILTGDALLTESFKVIAKDLHLDSETKLKIIDAYSDLAGVRGMVYGQELDLSNNFDNSDKDLVEDIAYHKTSCLFIAAFLAGMYIAKDDKHINDYKEMGRRLGIAYQMQDDLYDLIRSTDELGKPAQSDLKANKMTALSVYSPEEIKVRLDREFAYIMDMCDKWHFDTRDFKDLVNYIDKR